LTKKLIRLVHSLYRSPEALRHPKSTLRGPFGFAQGRLLKRRSSTVLPRLRCGSGFFRAVENLVNRQKLHDWGYVLASKGEIVWAKVTLSPFAG
jgi:hypothetical protein